MNLNSHPLYNTYKFCEENNYPKYLFKDYLVQLLNIFTKNNLNNAVYNYFYFYNDTVIFKAKSNNYEYIANWTMPKLKKAIIKNKIKKVCQ